MSADTPQPPDGETRVHPTEPAEGGDDSSSPDAADVRQHATAPAEGEDLPDE